MVERLSRVGMSAPVGRNPETGRLEPVEPIPTPAHVRAATRIRGLGWDIAYSECSAYGCSTYFAKLSDVRLNEDGSVTVEWVRKRRNNGLIGEQQIDVFVGGERIGGETSNFISSEVTRSVTGPGEPGETVRLTMRSFSDNSGEATDVVPQPPGDINVTGVAVSPAPAVVEQPATVSVAAENVGGSPAARSVTVTVDGSPVGTADFSLTAGETGTAGVTFAPSGTGEVTVAAAGASTTLRVVEPGLAVGLSPTSKTLLGSLAGGAAGIGVGLLR